MLELTEGEDGKVKQREEAKVTPGFFTYYSVEWGEGVVMTLLRGKTGEGQLSWEIRVELRTHYVEVSRKYSNGTDGLASG